MFRISVSGKVYKLPLYRTVYHTLPRYLRHQQCRGQDPRRQEEEETRGEAKHRKEKASTIPAKIRRLFMRGKK